MKHKINISHEMLMNIDFINTVNGGMSETFSNFFKIEEGIEVLVKIPGIMADDLQLEIIKGNEGKSYLRLFHLLPIFANKVNEAHWKSVRYLYNFIIPDRVDLNMIMATFNEDEKALIICLPFGRFQSGLRQIVEISRN